MPITDWPEGDRPREKLLSVGANQLSDTELLAIFYRTGVAGKTAVDLARETLSHFGSLRKLLNAPVEDFCQVPGLGKAKFAQLQATVELARRCLFEEIPKNQVLSNASQTKLYLRSRLRDYPYEVFAVLYLDSQHSIIRFDELFRGSVSSANVYPREVAREVLKYNASAVIFAHNHPSGNPEPSQSDTDITQTLINTLNLLDVKVLDHIIVGEKNAISLAERGLM